MRETLADTTSEIMSELGKFSLESTTKLGEVIFLSVGTDRGKRVLL